MHPKQQFPLKHASGKAFCNRVEERKNIIENIHASQHMLLISPRRYGKTSLVLYAAEESKTPMVRVDLFIAIDYQAINKLIIDGCKRLLSKMLSPSEKIIKLITDYFKTHHLQWMVGTNGASLELIPDNNIDATQQIIEMLTLIDMLLQKTQQTAVFFIDEFQEIGKFTQGRGIEGAIRHAAEQTKALCFIFSGSSRQMLLQLFDDRSRPLFNLCERIHISRIHEQDYQLFIQKFAQKTWKKALSNEALAQIFSITERHPYYMNVLCQRCWLASLDKPFSSRLVSSEWAEYLEQEQSKVVSDLTPLNRSELKVLVAIASGFREGLTSKSMLKMLDLSSSGVTKAISTLISADYIEKTAQGIRVIDPLIAWALRKHYPKSF